jgi:hypothetical protein
MGPLPAVEIANPARLPATLFSLSGLAVVSQAAQATSLHRRRLPASGPSPQAGLAEDELSRSAGRVVQTSRLLVDLLRHRYTVTVEEMQQRLQLATCGPLGGPCLHTPSEIADGLLLISVIVPEAALHDANVALLSKLRSWAGAEGFRAVCARLAAALESPLHGRAAQRLGKGDLTWLEFLIILRSALGSRALSHRSLHSSRWTSAPAQTAPASL